MSIQPEHIATAPIRAHRLGDALLLAVWDEQQGEAGHPDPGGGNAASRIVIARLEDGTRATAQSTLRLALESSGHQEWRRHFMLVRFPAPRLGSARELQLEGIDPPRTVELTSGAPAAQDALSRQLTARLDASARDRLARWLLRFCGGLSGLVSTADAAALGGALAVAAARDDRKLEWLAGLGHDHCLLGSLLPASLGPVQFVAILGESGIELSRGGESRAASPWVAVEKVAMRGARVCVIACRGAIAIRRIEAERPRTLDLLAWMKSHADDRGDRLDEVLTAIEPFTRGDANLRGLSLELQLRFPRRRRAALQAQGPVAAELWFAVADDSGGVFLCGWIHDPHGLVESAAMETLFGARQSVELDAVRFPSRDATERCKELGRHQHSGRELGFAAYVQGVKCVIRCLQPRLEIQLRSGTRLRLVPAIQPDDPARAKALVLSSIPVPCIDHGTLERCLAPSVSRLHDEHMRRERIDVVHELGAAPGSPSVSVIVPLYKNIQYLKTQLAAMALDPGLRDAELILVLDSPEMARPLLHLLEGLHACYGIALRLVVMRENFGYAPACNAGASQARARELLMLNSDVLPQGTGWLEVLREALHEADEVAAVGPRLLFDDGSLQHAGLHFAQDQKGRWLNRHYYKGLPGGYAPANQPREVPGVTGACLLVSTTAFREVGGFSECYVFGDYEDSDLCLKLRDAGYVIRYEPRASLYHVERKSIALHDGYSQSAAWLYNCAQHQCRWEEDITTLMARFEPDRDDGVAPAPGWRVVREAEVLPEVVALEFGTGARP